MGRILELGTFLLISFPYLFFPLTRFHDPNPLPFRFISRHPYPRSTSSFSRLSYHSTAFVNTVFIIAFITTTTFIATTFVTITIIIIMRTSLALSLIATATLALTFTPVTEAFPRVFAPETKQTIVTGAAGGFAGGAGSSLGSSIITKIMDHKKTGGKDKKKDASSAQPPDASSSQPTDSSNTNTSQSTGSSNTTTSQVSSLSPGLQTFTKQVGSDVRMTFFIETYDPAHAPVSNSKAVLTQPMPGTSGLPVHVVGDDGQGHRVTTYIERRLPNATNGVQQI